VVYDEGYLERVFVAMGARAPGSGCRRSAEYLDAHPPPGACTYLRPPTRSSWNGPWRPRPPGRWRSGARNLRRAGAADRFPAVSCGAGSGTAFLLKYPEANHMHKRMLDVSARCGAGIPVRHRCARARAARVARAGERCPTGTGSSAGSISTTCGTNLPESHRG